MSSKSDNWENGLMLLLFNNTTYTLVGDAAGLLKSVGDGDLFISLHVGTPGEAGDQTTNEATYTSYARVAVARTAGGWTVAANAVSNTAAVPFITCTGGTNTVDFFGIGTDTSGVGKLLYYGPLTSSLAVSNGITPNFAAGDIDVTED